MLLPRRITLAPGSPTGYLPAQAVSRTTTISDMCLVGACSSFDFLRLLMRPPGTSSNLFNAACAPIPPINTTASTFTALAEDLAALVNQVHSVGTREEYAVYPNP